MRRLRPNPMLPPATLPGIAGSAALRLRQALDPSHAGQTQAAREVAEAWSRQGAESPAEARLLAEWYEAALSVWLRGHRSDETVRSYMRSVTHAFAWLAVHEYGGELPAPHRVNEAAAQRYLDYLSNPDHAPQEPAALADTTGIASLSVPRDFAAKVLAWVYGTIGRQRDQPLPPVGEVDFRLVYTDQAWRQRHKLWRARDIAEGMAAEGLTAHPTSEEMLWEMRNRPKNNSFDRALSALVKSGYLARIPTWTQWERMASPTDVAGSPFPDSPVGSDDDERPPKNVYPYDSCLYSPPLARTATAQPSTVRQRAAALNSFWARMTAAQGKRFPERIEGMRGWSPFGHVEKQLGTTAANAIAVRKDARRLTRQHVSLLMARLDELCQRREGKPSIRRLMALRDRLALLILWKMGLRVHEMCGLQRGSFRYEEADGTRLLMATYTKKGGHLRRAFVPREVELAYAELDAGMGDYLSRAGGLTPDNPAFTALGAPGERGNPYLPYLHTWTARDGSGELVFPEAPLVPGIARWGETLEFLRSRHFEHEDEYGEASRVPFDLRLEPARKEVVEKALKRFVFYTAPDGAKRVLWLFDPVMLIPWDEAGMRRRLQELAGWLDAHHPGMEFKKRLHPHNFRRFAASETTVSGGLGAARDQLGHESEKMTAGYAGDVAIALEKKRREDAALAAAQATAPAPAPVAADAARGAEGEQQAGSKEPQETRPAGEQQAGSEETKPTVTKLPTMDPATEGAKKPKKPKVVLSPVEKLRAKFPPKVAKAVETAVADPTKAVAEGAKAVEAATRSPVKVEGEKLTTLSEKTMPQVRRRLATSTGATPGGEAPPPMPQAPRGQKGVVYAIGTLMRQRRDQMWFVPPSLAGVPPGAEPVPVTKRELVALEADSWLLPYTTVTQADLAPGLIQAQVWTGLRSLLPYRIAAQNDSILADPRAAGAERLLDSPPNPALLERFTPNARGESAGRAVAIPVLRVDRAQESHAELARLAMALYERHLDTGRVDAARAMVTWFFNLADHANFVQASARRERTLRWVGPGESVGDEPNLYGPTAELGKRQKRWSEWREKVRGETLREHRVEDVVAFLDGPGRLWHGPIEEPSGLAEFFKTQQLRREATEEVSLFAAMLRARTTEAKAGLYRYVVPRWAAVADPLGDPQEGLPEDERMAFRAWLRGLVPSETNRSLAADLLSAMPQSELDFPALALDQFWGLVLSELGAPEGLSDEEFLLWAKRPFVLQVPESPEWKQFRRDFGSVFGVDPLLGCLRTLRALWEMRRSQGRESSRRKDVFTARDEGKKNDPWSLIFAWCLPGPADVELAEAFRTGEGGGRARDDLQTAFQRLANIASLNALVALVEQRLEGLRQAWAAYYEDNEGDEATLREVAEEAVEDILAATRDLDQAEEVVQFVRELRLREAEQRAKKLAEKEKEKGRADVATERKRAEEIVEREKDIIGEATPTRGKRGKTTEELVDLVERLGLGEPVPPGWDKMGPAERQKTKFFQQAKVPPSWVQMGAEELRRRLDEDASFVVALKLLLEAMLTVPMREGFSLADLQARMQGHEEAKVEAEGPKGRGGQVGVRGSESKEADEEVGKSEAEKMRERERGEARGMAISEEDIELIKESAEAGDEESVYEYLLTKRMAEEMARSKEARQAVVTQYGAELRALAKALVKQYARSRYTKNYTPNFAPSEKYAELLAGRRVRGGQPSLVLPGFRLLRQIRLNPFVLALALAI